MARIIRAKLAGPEAQLGDVAAADVAKLIIGLERALAHAAYVALGTSRGSQSGRHRAAIERSTRLRFVGVEPGSVIELLALPDLAASTDDELPLAVTDLGGAAFDELLRAISSTADDVDVELASAIAQLGDELAIGERNEYVSFAELDSVSELLQAGAVLDRTVRVRMHAIADRPQRSHDDTLVGTLVEADFERGTARLQPTIGIAVVVTFPDEMADDIHDALRQPAQLQGEVRFDPRTAIAREIRLRRVTRADQLVLGGQTFFVQPTVSKLASEQGVGVVAEPAELSDADLTPEERAAFLAPLIEA